MSFKLPKNSKTCRVVKVNENQSVYICRYLCGLIEIGRYVNELLEWRITFALDKISTIELADRNELGDKYFEIIIWSNDGAKNPNTFSFDEITHANQIYDFCLKCLSTYYSNKLSIKTKPKKKKVASKKSSASSASTSSVSSAKTTTVSSSIVSPKASSALASSSTNTKELPMPSLRSNLYPVLNDDYFPRAPSTEPMFPSDESGFLSDAPSPPAYSPWTVKDQPCGLRKANSEAVDPDQPLITF